MRQRVRLLLSFVAIFIISCVVSPLASASSDDIVAGDYYTSSFKLYSPPSTATPFYSSTYIACLASTATSRGSLTSSLLLTPGSYLSGGSAITEGVSTLGGNSYVLSGYSSNAGTTYYTCFFSSDAPSTSTNINSQLPYYSRRTVAISLLPAALTSQSFSLSGTFGTSIYNYIQSDKPSSGYPSAYPDGIYYTQHFNRCTWYLYVNGEIVSTVPSAYGGVTFNNFTYTADKPLSSIYLVAVTPTTPFVWPNLPSGLSGYQRFYSSGQFLCKGARLTVYLPDASVENGGSATSSVPDGIDQETPPTGGGTGGGNTGDGNDYSGALDDINNSLQEGFDDLGNKIEHGFGDVGDRVGNGFAGLEQKQEEQHNEVMGSDDPENPSGLKGIIYFLKHLPEMIVNLFIPSSDDIHEFLQNLSDQLENLGFIGQASSTVIDLFDGIADTLDGEFHGDGFRFPGIWITLDGTQHYIVEPQTVDLKDNELVSLLSPTLSTIAIIVTTLALLNSIIRLAEAIFVSKTLASYDSGAGGSSTSTEIAVRE